MRTYLSLLRDSLGRALLVALIVLVVSTSGYILLAQYSWLDALFMTVITLGTVGYGEVQPLNQTGQIWSMLVIVSGYGVLVNITARFTSLLLSGAFAENRDNSRRKKLIANCNNHLVVVGYGRVGRSTVESTISAQKTCVVIEATRIYDVRLKKQEQSRSSVMHAILMFSVKPQLNGLNASSRRCQMRTI